MRLGGVVEDRRLERAGEMCEGSSQCSLILASYRTIEVTGSLHLCPSRKKGGDDDGWLTEGYHATIILNKLDMVSNR
jgi:hypothetical protein